MNDLPSLFRWAVTQAEAAASIPPLAIHQASYPRDHTGAPVRTAEIIRARPFTVAFEKYVDDDEQKSPIEKALYRFYDPYAKRQSLEFQVCFGIVIGHHDLETLRGMLGITPSAMDQIALGGLKYLREATLKIVNDQVAATPQTIEPAGSPSTWRERRLRPLDWDSDVLCAVCRHGIDYHNPRGDAPKAGGCRWYWKRDELDDDPHQCGCLVFRGPRRTDTQTRRQRAHV